MATASTTQPALVQRSHQLLPLASPESLGFDPKGSPSLEQLIECHITQDRYPGAQIAIASPGTFGHGGAGSSYSWADPDSGVSFSYLTNSRAPEPWHSVRLDQVSNLVHSAIV